MSRGKIAILILITGTIALVAYFGGQQFLGQKSMKSVQVEIAAPISTQIVPPSPDIFNKEAINPTVKITIEENNQDPIGQ